MLIVSANKVQTTPDTECTAYCDASGNEGDPVLFTAGFASSEAKWLEFEESWGALMTEYNIKQPFHTTTYWVGSGDDYAQFRRNDARRTEFEEKAVAIIKATTRKPFSFGVLPLELEAANAAYEAPDIYRTAYGTCGMMAIFTALQWMNRHKSGHNRVEKLKFVFEDGDAAGPDLQKAIRDVTGENIIFDTKKNIPQFAIADILGWRHARFVKTSFTPATDRHECFANLLHQVPRDECLMLSRGGIGRAFEDFKYPKRQ
jgi:hypothetical protein